MSLNAKRSFWEDAPVGALGLSVAIMGAAICALKLPAWLAILCGMLLGGLAQVVLANLIQFVNREAWRRVKPRVSVEARDGVVVLEVSYASERVHVEMSPDGAMQVARSFVGAALELDRNSEHRIEMH